MSCWLAIGQTELNLTIDILRRLSRMAYLAQTSVSEYSIEVWRESKRQKAPFDITP